jgi:hypothetical protein
MPVNPYFDHYDATNEQDLLESLIIESIQIYGFNSYYMPRTLDDYDQVFRESTVNSFNSATLIEAYLKSNMRFEGDGKFMSQQLGLEIRDQTTFTIAQSTFRTLTGLERPKEGDLMYLPMDRKVYEIQFVEHQDLFYQLGRLMVFDLQCELLEFNGQKFNTGIAEIDSIETTYQMDGTEDDTFTDWSDQSTEIQEETDGIIDFSEVDPFSRGGTV